jgi:hypothetical protein
MKQLNVFFDDLEYMKIVEQKGNKTWREFLLYLVDEVKNK